MTKLYYEAHVTIEHIEQDLIPELESIARRYNFKVANFLMVKDKSPDQFASTRATGILDIEARTFGFCKELIAEGFKLKRYKIEDTLLDSKMEDDPLGVWK